MAIQTRLRHAQPEDSLARRVRLKVLGGAPVRALALAIVLVVVIAAITGSALAPHDPMAQNPLLGAAPPTDGHLLGTDVLGRDVLSLLIAGARWAVLGPLVVALGCGLIGVLLGLLAAYYGGIIDAAANRLADLIYALPSLIVAIVVVGVLDGGYWMVAILLTFLSVPYQIRIIRSVTLAQVNLPYVEAARTSGVSDARTLLFHVLPNIVPTVVATLLLDFVTAMIGYTALAFLGIGVPAGTPNWGAMIGAGQTTIFMNPWLAVTPAIALILTATSVTLLGDHLHEVHDKKAAVR
ncbi:ABC transporter permease [Ornithinimicrobium faecis]|uniref:ABC transporter permease n=1 Tax=Ornithinimicrobium faecis TaxID=2934158 RepID=A0ABY4YWY3_9MICO|nr:ABC transporter permease [Ornithinimicrobium sp. HY1793]USQ81278.1 ABC transporter permease [Ornithinimicrobium sp. HY1793]